LVAVKDVGLFQAIHCWW